MQPSADKPFGKWGDRPWTADERADGFRQAVEYAFTGGIHAIILGEAAVTSPATRDYLLREAALRLTTPTPNAWWRSVIAQRDAWPEWEAYLAWEAGREDRARSAAARKGWETRRRRKAQYEAA